MKQRSVAEQLEKLEAPKPRAEARLAARNAALVEFARVKAGQLSQEQPTPEESARQGFRSWFRLSRNETRDGSAAMTWGLVSRRSLSAVASGCVVAFAVAIMWPMFRDRLFPPLLEQPEATVDLHRTQRPVEIPKAADVPARAATPVPEAAPTTEPESARAPVKARTRQAPQPSAFVIEPIEEPLPQPEIVIPQENLADAAPAPAPVPLPAQATAPTPAQSNYAPSEDMSEVIVTGARGRSSSMSTYKRVAPPVRTAGASGRARALVSEPKEKDLKPVYQPEGNDKFEHFDSNPIKRVIGADAVSTFSVDVDTASYSFARRMINEGRLPPKDAVRVEEMVNYFDYAWPKPESRKTPFAATIAVSDSPWTKGKKLVHIGIKGYDIDRDEVPDANLVFLIDVSGSMDSPDKLPLAVQSMKLLLQRLKPTDTVGIVVYAGAAGLVLEPTPVKDERKIIKALDSLEPGGSTAGAEGIELAYQLAEQSFRKGGVNRVMLATDGDFNVGINDTQALKSFIERKREKGIFLSVLGFGEGNYRDELAQALAQNGNGVAAYIDTIDEAKKVLVEQSTGSLFTIAKDVKLQVEFNPRTVAEYRLVGYETRALKREDFNNDKVDAGDVGAGHTVTALYEITPVGSSAVSVDPLRYQAEDDLDKGIMAGSRGEYGFLKIRYKLPNEDTSTLVSQPIPLETPNLGAAVQREVGFSTAVAGFAQLLRGGAYTGRLTYDDVIEEAQKSRGEDRKGYRAEFIQLVRKAMRAKGM